MVLIARESPRFIAYDTHASVSSPYGNFHLYTQQSCPERVNAGANADLAEGMVVGAVKGLEVKSKEA